jgi:hypothetical protein
MVSVKLQDIIDNFEQQHKLYGDMAELSATQLQILQDWNGNDSLQQALANVMTRRQKLMQEIIAVNSENQRWQQEVCGQWEIGAFTISQLRGKAEQEQLQRLEQVVQHLGTILEQINGSDRQNQSLMSNLTAPGTRFTPGTPVRTSAANAAYRQAMEQGKSKDEQ